MSAQTNELHGMFDNRETMRREAWINGQLAAQWVSTLCATHAGDTSLMPWERRALEAPWGHYPHPPPIDR